MPEPIDMAYLVTRERHSREMAAEPGDVSIKWAHRNMADAYAARIATALLATPKP
jgi:hypothetical protein